MMKRKTKEMVRFLRKAEQLLRDIAIQFKPEDDERAAELVETIVNIQKAIEKDYKLNKSELVFVMNLVAGFICNASANAIEEAEEEAKKV